MKRKATVLILLAALLSSCTGSSREKTLTICGITKVDGKSAADGCNLFQNQLEDLLFTPLANIDSRGRMHGILVKGVRPAGDVRVWEVALKEGVRFHDGSPVTAADAAFSIEKRRETDAGSGLGKIRQVEVVNDREIRLRFDSPVPDILNLLQGVYIYPRHVCGINEPWREALLKNPVGSGPFRFKRWLENGIELEANEDYFEGRPKVERVVYIYEDDEDKRLTRLLKGNADILTPVSPEAAAFIGEDPKFYVNKATVPYYVALFLNTGSPVFGDRAVRRAVNMAVSRERIIEKCLDGAGVPARGPFPKDMLPEGYRGADYGYDPKAAVRLLREAGWRDMDGDGVVEKGGRELRFSLYYIAEFSEFKKVADMMTLQLYEAGIGVEMVPVSNTDFMNMHFPSGGYDAVLVVNDMYAWKRIWQSRSIYGAGSYNYSSYSNREADALFERAGKAKDILKIKGVYERIDRMIHEDAPAVFLYNPAWHSAVSRRFKEGGKFMGTAYDWYGIKDMEIGT